MLTNIHKYSSDQSHNRNTVLRCETGTFPKSKPVLVFVGRKISLKDCTGKKKKKYFKRRKKEGRYT